MPEYADDGNQIRETDLVFDCPYCGKSLAIDYRGAGLNIQCTDCGRNVQVPIPEGMEISDLDSSVEEQEIRVLNLRKALASSEERITHIEAELMEYRAGNKERGHSDDGGDWALILDQVKLIQESQARILAALQEKVREAGR